MNSRKDKTYTHSEEVSQPPPWKTVQNLQAEEKIEEKATSVASKKRKRPCKETCASCDRDITITITTVAWQFKEEKHLLLRNLSDTA